MVPDQEWTYSFCIGEADQSRFCEISGDNNPLHRDPGFAQRAGFDGPVVYGGLIVARISGFLGAVFPGAGCVWSKLAINFRAPLIVGRDAVLKVERTYGNDDLRIWELAMKVLDGETVIATGSVQVSLRPGEE